MTDTAGRHNLFLVPLTNDIGGPLGSIVGYRAPSTWDSVQVKLPVNVDDRGWLDTSRTHRRTQQTRRGTQQGVLDLQVTRSGRIEATLHIDRQRLRVENIALVQPHLDVLTRVLGLPTATDVPNFNEFVELVWLDRVMQCRIAESPEHCPLHGDGFQPQAANECGQTTNIFGRVFPETLKKIGSWAALHELLSDPFNLSTDAAEATLPLGAYNAAQIEWMDVPMFARELTHALPSRDESLEMLIELGVDCSIWLPNVQSA